MDDVLIVQLLDHRDELSENDLDGGFGNGRRLPVSHNVVVEVAGGEKFYDSVEIFAVFEVV